MTKPIARALGGALLLALLVVPVAARADAIAVLGVEAEGVSEAQANQLAEALRAQARQTSGVKFVPSKDFMEMKFLYNCMDPATIATCLAPAGKSVGADKLVFGTLNTTKKKKVHVSIKLVDVRSGAVVKFVDEEVGTLDVTGSAGRWFASLVPAQALPPVVPPPPRNGQLALGSDPADATVTVDGVAQGNTPTNVSVKPGSHTVVIAKSGFESETRTVTVRAGENEKLDFSLKAKPEPKPPVVAENPLVPPPTAPVVATEHPGRVPMIVGGTLLALALIGGGIAIYTFKHYSDLQDTAHSDLNTLRNNENTMGGSAWVNGNAGFFAHPSCDVPSGGQMVNGYAQFVNDCNDGNHYAVITTVLDIAAGALAAAGVLSLAYGVRASRKAAEQPKTSFAPRLKLLSPVVSTQGGGLSAAFEF